MQGHDGTLNQTRKEKPMQYYEFCFEGECGLEKGEIEAKNLAQATKLLKEQFPDDIGADGCWTNKNGDEFPINW
jgi:hypothetical protein